MPYYTIAESVEHQYTHRHKAYSGGEEQFAQITAIIRTTGNGDGPKVINRIVDRGLPSHYIPAIEKGILQAAGTEIMDGYPVKGVEIELIDAEFHDVHSSSIAFGIAARRWFEKVVQELQQMQKLLLVE